MRITYELLDPDPVPPPQDPLPLPPEPVPEPEGPTPGPTRQAIDE